MTIRIDGRDIAISGRPTVLEAARAGGIDIPSLCDLPGLDPFAGCRLCLVEIRGRKGYAPACGTIAEDGLEVATQTPELRELRRGILELILSEHPNACLACSERSTCVELKAAMRKAADVTGCFACPQNGRCRLQEVMDLVGLARVSLPPLYRNREVRRDDPFFDRDDNLCILCGRCVRVCGEVRGAAVLTFVSRGPETLVGTALDRGLLESGCQFCGACVDVCPTGALVERAVRLRGPADAAAATVCPLCSLGCSLGVSLQRGEILATGPAAGGQICVKGRFLVREIASSEQRILRPHVRRTGGLEPAGWDDALSTAAALLREAGPGTVEVRPAPEASLEEAYAAARLGRALGSRTIAATGPEPFLGRVRAWEKARGVRLAEREALAFDGPEPLLVLGLDLPISHPALWVGLVAAKRRGAKLVLAHPGHLSNPGRADVALSYRPGAEAALAAVLMKAMVEQDGVSAEAASLRALLDAWTLESLLDESGAGEAGVRAAAGLLTSGAPRILFGGPSFGGDRPAEALSAVWDLARLTGGRLHPLPATINETAWAELSAAGPLDPGPGPGAAILGGPADPAAGPRPAVLVAIDSHWNETSRAADVVLPAAVFTETGGRWLTADGRSVESAAAVPPPAEARPGWRIYCDLAGALGLAGFDFDDLDSIRVAIARDFPGFEAGAAPEAAEPVSGPFLPFYPEAAAPAVSPGFPFISTGDWDFDRYRGCRLSAVSRGFGRLRERRRIRRSE